MATKASRSPRRAAASCRLAVTPPPRSIKCPPVARAPTQAPERLARLHGRCYSFLGREPGREHRMPPSNRSGRLQDAGRPVVSSFAVEICRQKRGLPRLWQQARHLYELVAPGTDTLRGAGAASTQAAARSEPLSLQVLSSAQQPGAVVAPDDAVAMAAEPADVRLDAAPRGEAAVLDAELAVDVDQAAPGWPSGAREALRRPGSWRGS